MSEWLIPTLIVAAVLVCPALMWLGRRGIGPGRVIGCRRTPVDELKAQQQRLAAEIARLESRG